MTRPPSPRYVLRTRATLRPEEQALFFRLLREGRSLVHILQERVLPSISSRTTMQRYLLHLKETDPDGAYAEYHAALLEGQRLRRAPRTNPTRPWSAAEVQELVGLALEPRELVCLAFEGRRKPAAVLRMWGRVRLVLTLTVRPPAPSPHVFTGPATFTHRRERWTVHDRALLQGYVDRSDLPGAEDLFDGQRSRGRIRRLFHALAHPTDAAELLQSPDRCALLARFLRPLNVVDACAAFHGHYHAAQVLEAFLGLPEAAAPLHTTRSEVRAYLTGFADGFHRAATDAPLPAPPLSSEEEAALQPHYLRGQADGVAQKAVQTRFALASLRAQTALAPSGRPSHAREEPVGHP